MQRDEEDLIIPLNTDPRGRLIGLSVLVVSVLAVNGFVAVQEVMLGMGSTLVVVQIVVGAALLLGYGWAVTRAIRHLRAPGPTLRVSHDGVFFSVLIRWEDISAIIPYSAPLAGLMVGIVVRDEGTLLARVIEGTASGVIDRFFLRLAQQINTWLFRCIPGYRARVNIPQSILPLSVHALLAEVCTRFATELQTHQVMVGEGSA
jgi:hypothetical protein